MDTIIKNIISGSDIEFTDSLLAFTKDFETQRNFDELNRDNLRRDVWESIFKHLDQVKYFTIHERCLTVLRILSRDKTDLDDLVTKERLNVVLKCAGIADVSKVQCSNCTNVTTEALKLLTNLIYNSTSVQKRIGETSCLHCIIKRLSSSEEIASDEVKLADLRILFLSIAYEVPLRDVVKNELNGDDKLINQLDKLATKLESTESEIAVNDIILACEILKVLFTLYYKSVDNFNDDSQTEEKDRIKKLVHIMYRLLVNRKIDTSNRKTELHSNIVNMLAAIPYGCHEPIIPPIRGIDGEISYHNVDMSAIDQILKFLDQRLDMKTDLVANIMPVISALTRLVKNERLIRKYVRLQVLPPLKDVMKRPEEGSTLRAKLCKLLSMTELYDLVAEFIFVLCKENVNRMIKYSGYGNAAGMFANKGLLGRNQSSNSSRYSSESEDSDTEEYVKYRENINPVTGCYEHPKPNPLEGMSDEQKVYEAMKLVDLVNQLMEKGVVQPCRIGEDGTPKPIEHILELQEELPKQHNVTNQSND